MRAYLIYVLYWAIQAVAFPFLLLYLCWRIARNPAYRHGLSERFGFLPKPILAAAPGAIWLHAVSVGEVLTAAALLHRLHAELPLTPLYVSCSTLAGRAIAEEKLAGFTAAVFYAPLDYRFAVRRILRRLRPALVIVMETEIWPNLFRDAHLSGAQLLVANARISDRALPGYLRFRWFFRHTLAWPGRILAQDETAASRYRALGAPRVTAAGNLKYDFDPGATAIAPCVGELLDNLRPELVWIAASTMPPAAPEDPDEDDVVLDAFSSLAPRYPRLLLILAPRRPERFASAAGNIARRGIACIRRSELPSAQLPALPCVLLLDTIGELNGLFRTATAVFMGGTLARRGGHNPLEPAAFGVPVLLGPHMENFTEIAAEFRASNAVVDLPGPASLAPALLRLFADPDWRSSLGARGREVALRRRGATARALACALELHDLGLARPPRFNPFGLLWLAGMAIHRASARLRVDRAERPVVSIGNLAMGGTGKTPLTVWLCERLAAQGLRPAVLIRGYRRSWSERAVTALPGASLPVESTGEEAQLILRSGHAAVAIGANRLRARRALLDSYRPDIYILDDGFQHWCTRRGLDIVLIDAIDPFRGGVFPRGRLREPFAALARAGAIVVSSAERGRKYCGLTEEIRKYNASAPIYFSSISATIPPFPRDVRPGAFCGLGQPESFRRTLAAHGADPLFFRVFPDHFHYRPEDLDPLLAAAPILLTTEKDFANLPAGYRDSGKILAVPIRIEVRESERLLAQVLALAGERRRPFTEAGGS